MWRALVSLPEHLPHLRLGQLQVIEVAVEIVDVSIKRGVKCAIGRLVGEPHEARQPIDGRREPQL